MTPARAEYITFSDYRAAEGINGSWLKEMGTSPLHFHTAPTRERKDTPALRIGRPIHTAVLEPELFDAVTAVWEGGLTKKGEPTMSKNSSDYKRWAKAMAAEGRQPLEADEQWLCRRIRRAVMEHPIASKMVADAEPELSIFWTHPIGIERKSRLDLLRRARFVADLKTALDISPEKFGRQAHKLGYHVQGADYQDAAKALTGLTLPYYIIAVEKVEPFDVAVYELPDAILDVGRAKYCNNLRKVKECRETGIWPGVGDDIQTLEFPPWAFDDEEVLDWTGVETATV